MKNLKKIFAVVLALATIGACITGCQKKSTETASDGYVDTITMVWQPNESAEDYDIARNEFARLIEQATGKKVEHQLTTDYAIAIEAMVTGKAQICFNGAEAYVEAHKKNEKVLPLMVNSGESGTLEDAMYYSFFAVEEANAEEYSNGNGYSIDNIEGKKMSFVSNSSTSGFKVPTNSITTYFEDKNLDKDMIIEGGAFFSEVMFGGSHQGSAFNLMSGKADVAAFCDTQIRPYAECVEGEANQVGSVYMIKNDAPAPFDQVRGERFVIIQSTPVLNTPFSYNSEALSPEDVKAIQDLFTSNEVTNNPKIFIPEGSDGVGVFHKKGDNKFVLVDDEWFEPIRKMSK